MDTIPEKVKSAFFADKDKPDLLKDYDVLGFDVDYCIARYNDANMLKLMCDAAANDLCSYGYPEKIREWPSSLAAMALNNVIWDIEHRTFIKLGEGKLVVRACRGSKKLTEAEI